MKRQKLNRSKDRKVFRATQKQHASNNLSGRALARGGIRR